MPAPFSIQSVDHIGIRVSDRDVSIPFYEALGFREVQAFPEHEATEMQARSGVRINLIMNGAKRRGGKNVLLDDPIKLPGHTHPAFIVDKLDVMVSWLAERGIRVTEGPVDIGPRRKALFIRDPDGNVLEFDELLDTSSPHGVEALDEAL